MVGMTAEERKIYYKKYYENPENREKQRARARAYNESEKGKELKKIWREAHSEELSKYHKDYGKKARETAKSKGLCCMCYKNPVELNRVACSSCREKNALNSSKRGKQDGIE
jgi:hypothetical protein